MPRLFIRILSSFLVPCLLVKLPLNSKEDPSDRSFPEQKIQEQALAPQPLSAHHEAYPHPTLLSIIKELGEVLEFHMPPRPAAVVILGSARPQPGDEVYELAYKAGQEAFRQRFSIRGGAGPGTMEAYFKGYSDVRDAAEAKYDPRYQTQGIRILLPFEKAVNDFTEVKIKCDNFITRKLGLYGHTVGMIAVPGGIGTLDEMFEVWQRGRPLVLLEPDSGPHAYYWTKKIEVWRKAWETAGLAGQIPPFPPVTTSPQIAMELIAKMESRKRPGEAISLEKTVMELTEGWLTIEQWKAATTFIGRPKKGSEEWHQAVQLIGDLLKAGKTVRIGTQGPLVEVVQEYLKNPDYAEQLQGVFFVPPGKEFDAAKTGFKHIVITHDPSVHQVLVTKRVVRMVFLPGGIGTMNRLFDLLQLIQTNKIKPIDVVLLGHQFWSSFMTPTMEDLLREAPVYDDPATLHQAIDEKTEKPKVYTMISKGDERYIEMPKFPPEVKRLFGLPVEKGSYQLIRPLEEGIRMVIWDMNGTLVRWNGQEQIAMGEMTAMMNSISFLNPENPQIIQHVVSRLVCDGEAILSRLNLRDYFRSISTGVTEKHLVFKQLIQNAGLNPKQVLIIGNKGTDAEAGRLVGAPVMLLANSPQSYWQILAAEMADIAVYRNWHQIAHKIPEILARENHSAAWSIRSAA